MTEFSFEELRAIKYRRKRAEQESKKMEEEKLRWKEEQNELLRKQVLHQNFGELGSRLEVRLQAIIKALISKSSRFDAQYFY